MYSSIGPQIGGGKGIGGHEGGWCALIGPVSRSNLSGASSHYHRLLDISRGQFRDRQSWQIDDIAMIRRPFESPRHLHSLFRIPILKLQRRR